MKLWIDDVRPAPEGYVWCKSVNDAKDAIVNANAAFVASCKSGLPNESLLVEFISLDHDAGEYVSDGGDYIRLFDWLEETGRNYPIRIHSMNVVGRENMLRICKKIIGQFWINSYSEFL